jgi:hypothetical protein
MATLARIRLDLEVGTLSRPAALGFAPIPTALTAALAVAVLLATAGSLLLPNLLRGPAASVGQLQGTALVLLMITLPTLVASVLLARRGWAAGVVGWIGALGSIAYQSMLLLFFTPYNAFFFLYVALLGLSIWSLVAMALASPHERIGDLVGRHAPVRFVAGYLVLNAGLFLVLWLRATVPALWEPFPPRFLEGSGALTGVVQVIDFAFTLPLMFLAAWLLVRREPWGYLLSGALLVMLAIETASIAADQWLGHAADPASPVASVELVPVFAVLTLIGVAVLAVFFRPGPSTPAQAAPNE